MKLAITGATGAVGTILRRELKGLDPIWVARRLPEDALSSEAWRIADATDPEALGTAMEGVDAVFHMACVHGFDISFEETLDVNYRGTIATYEAAIAAGVKHLIFASSNHGWGFYKRDETPIELAAPVRPDGWYGVAKIWGEAVTAYYAEAHGIHGTSLRIGHTNDHVPTAREGFMWSSIADLASLIELVLKNPAPGHRSLWATANCSDPFFDSSATYDLGWQPKDAPDAFRPEGTGPLAGEDIGGNFAKANRKS